ncbi:Uncharacterised protein [Salmonella enterica subsp. enterica serovar Bovismorbificans]|nr:Uncharacterised protein [Salmonella enterica subsp. enterica serovar Bovismorbificans]
MRIIEVNGDFIRQILIGFMQLIMTVQDILYRRRDQKILLAQAQLSSGIGGIVRVEHP